MTTIFSVTAALGTAVAILFAPAATADHNTTNQFEFSCINDVYCEGGPWDEKIIGDLRSQRIEGKGGADDVIGNRGIDWLDGGTGRDDVWGGEDDDRIYGDRGEDELHGGNDDDKVYAGCYGGCDQTGDNRDFLYGERATTSSGPRTTRRTRSAAAQASMKCGQIRRTMLPRAARWSTSTSERTRPAGA